MDAHFLQFFDSKAWDTQAEVLPRTEAGTALLTSLFDTSTFRKILKQCEKQGKHLEPLSIVLVPSLRT